MLVAVAFGFFIKDLRWAAGAVLGWCAAVVALDAFLTSYDARFSAAGVDWDRFTQRIAIGLVMTLVLSALAWWVGDWRRRKRAARVGQRWTE